MYQVHGCNSFHRIIGPVSTYLVTTKNGGDLIAIEDARMATTLNIDFSNIQGQLTPQSKVESGSIRTHSRCYGHPCYFQE